MKIDPSKEPTIVRLQGAIRVTLSLSGEEGDSWAQDYNTAAERAQIDASAVQWAISVTINDIDKVADTLGSAVGLLDVGQPRVFRAQQVGADDGGHGQRMVEAI